MIGTGSLAGFNRNIAIPFSFEIHSAPHTPFAPVQTFATEFFRGMKPVWRFIYYDILRAEDVGRESEMVGRYVTSFRDERRTDALRRKVQRELLSRVPFLEGASAQLIDDLASSLAQEQFPAGSVVFAEGSIGDRFYLVGAGVARVTKGEDVISDLGTGGCLGEGALLTDEPRSATVTALKDSTLYSLTRSSFEFLTEKYPAVRETLDKTIYRIINERRGSGEDTGDLLSMLLLARDGENDNTGMTAKQVRDETLTLFIAGHETTAMALTWAWHLLAANPEAEAKMHRELDEVLGDREPAFDDVPLLRYTGHVFGETMRLFPPAWAIGRMAVSELEVGGYTVPRKSIVLMSPYTMHHSAKWWPEPNEFRPERWDVDDAERPKFAYYPFGGGPRLCIGERFAWMEGVLILASLARKWRFRPADESPVELAPLFTLRPKGGLRLRAEARY